MRSKDFVDQSWRYILAALLACYCSVSNSQEATETPLSISQTSGAAALESLRNDDVEKALESLGAAADVIRNLHPTEDEGLAAAAGGLFRTLSQLDEGEQFDLLYPQI